MLIVNCGGMYSGKTTALLQLGDRYKIAGKIVKCFKPNIDTRYNSDKITNHLGHEMFAYNIDVDNPVEIVSYFNSNSDGQVCLIDEVQFFDPTIVDVIDQLISRGIIVAVAGLDMDFKKEPFENTALLMAKADKVTKHHAVCTKCGCDAIYSKKIIEDTSRIDVGSKDKYIAVCSECYKNKEINIFKCDECGCIASHSYKDKCYCGDCLMDLIESAPIFDVEVYEQKRYLFNNTWFDEDQYEELLDSMDMIEKL